MSIVISPTVQLIMADADATTLDFATNQATEISILKDITIDQGMNSITASASGVSSTPNRVSKIVNTGYTGARFSFKTYLKPVTDSGNVTSPEKLLWESLAATDVTDTASTSTVAFTAGNTNKLRELFFYLILENGSYYKVSNAVVESVDIDIDINKIAMATWKVVGLNMSYTTPGDLTTTAAKLLTDRVFIRNKLSTIDLSIGGLQNLLLHSEEFANAVWGNFALVITDDDALDPNSQLTADKIEDDSASQFERLNYSSADILPSTSYSFSIFIKKDSTPASTRFMKIQLTFTGGIPTSNWMTFDTSTGNKEESLSDPNGSTTVVDFDANWWQLVISAQSNSNSTGAFLQLWPAIGANADLLTTSGSTTGFIHAWGGQLVRGYQIPQYVKTTTAIVGSGFPEGIQSYNLALLKAKLSIKNSVHLIQRTKVGEISSPTGHYVADRSTSCDASFYLNDKALGSSVLQNNLLNYTTLSTANTLGNATLSIGGAANALRVDVPMPTSKITLKKPTVGLKNSVAILIRPQEATLGAGDELTLVYNN